jgi:circadian clock protein KaiC
MEFISSGITHLDNLLGGGFPLYSMTMIAGHAGTGKTSLTHQVIFCKACEGKKTLYLTTLSEPTLKMIRYQQNFSYFMAEEVGKKVIYKDIGLSFREKGLSETLMLIQGLIKKENPSFLVIDSFKAIRDLSPSDKQFREFFYDLSIHLSNREITSFMVGEYSQEEVQTEPEFSIADGVIYISIMERMGEYQRFIQIRKMRGSAIEDAPFPFIICHNGIVLLSSRIKENKGRHEHAWIMKTGNTALDLLFRGGVQGGRIIIISGNAGTGKTTVSLEILYKGANIYKEKGMLISFEEDERRIIDYAEGLGWYLKPLIAKGLIKIISIPQSAIKVERDLRAIGELIKKFQPQRVVIDSLSAFIYRLEVRSMQRDKTAQLASLVKGAGAVGFFVSDISSISHGLSRFGVEETIADGVILLSADIEEGKRRRYLEVYKMRGTAHAPDRHRMEITDSGVEIFYHKPPKFKKKEELKRVIFPPFEKIITPAPAFGTTWMVTGDSGTGKSIMAYHFAFEGLRRKENVVFITFEIPPYQVRENMVNFGFLVTPYEEMGTFRLIDGFSNLSCGRGTFGDISDAERFIYYLLKILNDIKHPCRVVIDSLTPLTIHYSPDEFVELIHQKNNLLKQFDFDIVALDTAQSDILPSVNTSRLYGIYDIICKLFVPDWGEMKLRGGRGTMTLQIKKARGAKRDESPYPFSIVPGEGISVKRGFYYNATT